MGETGKITEIKTVWITGGAVAAAGMLALAAWKTERADLLVYAVAVMWLGSVLFCLIRCKERILLLFFLAAFFLFLLFRPLWDTLTGADWVTALKEQYYADANPKLALELMLLSLCAVLAGAGAAVRNNYQQRNGDRGCRVVGRLFRPAFFRIAEGVFWAAFICRIPQGIEKIRFAAAHSYEEYYVFYESSLPYVINAFGELLYPALIFGLAGRPPKRKAFWMLAAYGVSTIPMLLVGARNPLVLSAAVAVLYYFLRDGIKDRERWFGRLEKTVLVICLPVGLLFLGAYNYIRDGAGALAAGLFQIGMIGDFFYRQGVSFSWLSSGLGAMNDLPSGRWVNYTFGGLVDYFHESSAAKYLFGIQGMGSQNSLVRATRGNSMAHHISWLLLGDGYLEGHGCGSCYLLELYADYQFVGVLVFSLLLGFGLVWAVPRLKNSTWLWIAVLGSFPGLLFLPRGAVFDLYGWVVKMPYLGTFAVCAAGSLLYSRWKGGKYHDDGTDSGRRKRDKDALRNSKAVSGGA